MPLIYELAGRRLVRRSIMLAIGLSLYASAVNGAPNFTETLSEARLVELGLDGLTPAQRAGLNADIQAFVKDTQAEVRHKEVVRDLGKQPAATDPEIRLQSRLAGPFRGWTGNTIFHLENGQVWQQVDGDTYYRNYPNGVEVTIIPGSFGTFRLRLADGATVIVRRR